MSTQDSPAAAANGGAPSSRQTWSAEGYDKNARFVSDLGASIFSWLAPREGERILDLGCGDGVLTAKIAASGAEVVGTDVSEELLEAARRQGLDVRHADGHALPFDNEFEAVFSNAALHWMTEPRRVVEGIWRALRPGGRFVAEFGGHGNVAALVTAMRSAALAFGGDPALAGPWYYPTPGEYRALLEEFGFAVERIELVPRPTPLPTGVEGWLMTFRKPLFDQFPEGVREKALAHAVDLLRPALCDRSGHWTADYVRLRVLAVKPD
jgi:SAM-dependent methyltransferase